MQLTAINLSKVNSKKVDLPAESIFSLPEKILQFGTGVLLRGLPDYFVDYANKRNIFNGRIVVVKSTDSGDTKDFKEQDGLYTIVERGLSNGKQIENISINASISRVLSAKEDWDSILQCAANPAMQIIISNTTEVGISLLASDAVSKVPTSFPGRILRFLEARYETFHGSVEAGMVIIPTELIPANGTLLKEIVVKLASLQNADPKFIQWLSNANDFCNSLVDRIVPGKLSKIEQEKIEMELGYTDKLMIMSEPYCLWAIETQSARAKKILSFHTCNEGIIISHDINKFRELKLRLLNGTHILSCGLALIAGFQTVKEAMADANFVAYVSSLMHDEMVPLLIQNDITKSEATYFAFQVIDRFKNPFIDHYWKNITVQYTSKLVMRTVPLLEKYYSQNKSVPQLMALGFAAFILYMHSERNAENEFVGILNNTPYKIQDNKADLLFEKWASNSTNQVVTSILSDSNLFGKDLTQYPGFAESVNLYLATLTQNGAIKTINAQITQKQKHE